MLLEKFALSQNDSNGQQMQWKNTQLISKSTDEESACPFLSFFSPSPLAASTYA